MAIERTRGIDVSYYQGVINWQTVKAQGVDYVILRAGYGISTVDTQFVNNITGAIAAGFDNIGVYWFSYAHNADTAQNEVDFCAQTIEPYREHINLPVWFDWEGASYNYVQNTLGITLTAADIRDIATAWCNGIIAEGYTTGIYSNKSHGEEWYKLPNGQYLWEHLDVQFWYARYGANNETSLFVDPAFEATALAEHPETDFFQFSDQGQMSGINSNRIDLNIRYTEVIDPPDPPEPPEPPTPPPVVITVTPKNSIDYVEVRNENTDVIGIIDTAQSIIWHSVYYGVGDFEIYAQAVPAIVDMLQAGRYITRTDNREIGIIEKIEITDNPQDGTMITASGRFAKSILDRRLIYNLSGNENIATVISGNVETAIRSLVSNNAINCTFDSNRNIAILELGAVAGLTETIVDDAGNATEKQIPYDSLLSYTESVLEEYGLASVVVLDADARNLKYILYKGTNRSVSVIDGSMPIIFSQDFDNLSSCQYSYDITTEKNVALIGGEGEGIDRFFSLITSTAAGIDRKEIFVDAGSLNKKYKDAQDVEHTYTDAEYKALLDAQGKQILPQLVAAESFLGAIDITNGNHVYNRDFSLGDIVTVQDNNTGKYANVRIREVTEVQDENGYLVEAKYQ